MESLAKGAWETYNVGVERSGLEKSLMKLSETGRLVKDRPSRQIWRFEHEGKAYYLKFYLKRKGWIKKFLRGNPAMAEFVKLQMLQKAHIPAPRATAVLMGFRLGDRVGDAVIMEAIEPGVTLDRHLEGFRLRGEAIAEHRQLSAGVQEIVAKLGEARIGHMDLHLGNFILKEDKIYLLDAYAVRPGGMRTKDLMLLGHSVQDVATRGDFLRLWLKFRPGELPPTPNPVSKPLWEKMVGRSTKETEYCGRLSAEGWSGHHFKSFRYPKRWSRVSQMDLKKADWAGVWKLLRDQMESGQLELIEKNGRSEVMHGEVTLAGKPVAVEVRRRVGIGATKRAWLNAWQLVVRDVPTGWPVMFMQRSVMGIPVESVMVVERPGGERLSEVNLNGLDGNTARRDLMFRLGRQLRQMERRGVFHRNAKAMKWIVMEEDETTPVLMDADEVRPMGWKTSGIEKLLVSMQENKSYTPEDSFNLCRGYAPFSRMSVGAAEHPDGPGRTESA